MHPSLHGAPTPASLAAVLLPSAPKMPLPAARRMYISREQVRFSGTLGPTPSPIRTVRAVESRRSTGSPLALALAPAHLPPRW